MKKLEAIEWTAVRSLLFVPATVERFVQGAHQWGADAVILDLEDSVAAAAKRHARAMAAGAIATVAAQNKPVLVRINANSPETIAGDLASAVRPGLSGVVIPKAESPDDVAQVASALFDAELRNSVAPGSVALLPTIETPKGVLACEAVAGCHPRIDALMFGSEDFAAAMGVAPTPQALTYPAQRVALIAHANYIAAIGLVGSVAGFKDLETFRKIAEASRAIGMTGAGCIHPSQVPIANAAFSPSPEEIGWAERVCSAFEVAMQNGLGAVTVDGHMVDEPIYRRAAALRARTRRPA
ncbi:MAG: CoA ester lyase [Pseudolabrys sp.]|nr:CoA ester lyase [Pseudolabrys sp.]